MKKLNFLIKEITKKPKLSKGLRNIKIKETVIETIGKNLIKYILEIRVKENKVILKVSSSALRSELNYGKKKFLENINNKLIKDKIDDIIIK